jgi:hypothetical protein
LASVLVLAAVVACGSPLTPSSASRAPAVTTASDVQEISLEISALM